MKMYKKDIFFLKIIKNVSISINIQRGGYLAHGRVVFSQSCK